MDGDIIPNVLLYMKLKKSQKFLDRNQLHALTKAARRTVDEGSLVKSKLTQSRNLAF